MRESLLTKKGEGARKLKEVGTPPRGGGHHRPITIRGERFEYERMRSDPKGGDYLWVGRSQGKPWWRLEAVLTRKLIVKPGHRGERLIESPSSWFLPKFPLG